MQTENRCIGSGIGWAVFQSWLELFLAVKSGLIPFLLLYFLICKIWILITPILQICGGNFKEVIQINVYA